MLITWHVFLKIDDARHEMCYPVLPAFPTVYNMLPSPGVGISLVGDETSVAGNSLEEIFPDFPPLGSSTQRQNVL